MQRNLRTSQCEAHVLAGSAPSCGPGIQSGRRELSAGGDGRDKRRDRKKKKKKRRDREGGALMEIPLPPATGPRSGA